MAILLKHASSLSTFPVRDFLSLFLDSLLNFSTSITREEGMTSWGHQEKLLIQVTGVFKWFTEIFSMLLSILHFFQTLAGFTTSCWECCKWSLQQCSEIQIRHVKEQSKKVSYRIFWKYFITCKYLHVYCLWT